MKSLLLITISLLPGLLHAQKKESLIFFDQNWEICKTEEEARYLCAKEKMNDTTYKWQYYNINGSIRSIKTSKDADGNILNGYLAYFDAEGKIDSAGHVLSGKRNDWWYFYTDTLSIWVKKKYESGKLIEVLDSTAMRLKDEAAQNKFDSTDVMVAASFAGGDKEWMKYIQKKLSIPKRTRKIGVGGKIIVQFAIGFSGKIEDVIILQSVEYAIDSLIVEVIKKAPTWTPASLNGKEVKEYRRQPITIAF